VSTSTALLLVREGRDLLSTEDVEFLPLRCRCFRGGRRFRNGGVTDCATVRTGAAFTEVSLLCDSSSSSEAFGGFSLLGGRGVASASAWIIGRSSAPDRSLEARQGFQDSQIACLFRRAATSFQNKRGCVSGSTSSPVLPFGRPCLSARKKASPLNPDRQALTQRKLTGWKTGAPSQTLSARSSFRARRRNVGLRAIVACVKDRFRNAFRALPVQRALGFFTSAPDRPASRY